MPILDAFKRAAQGIYAVLGAITPTHRHLRERLFATFFVSLLVDLLASVAVLFSEGHASGTQIHSYGDALFWTTGQLLTVSSQLRNPVTVTGRMIDILLELYAITIVTAMAGSFGAFFHRRSLEQHPYAPPVTAE